MVLNQCSRAGVGVKEGCGPIRARDSPPQAKGAFGGRNCLNTATPRTATTFRAGAVNKKTIVRSVDVGVGDSNCSSRLGNEGDV